MTPERVGGRPDGRRRGRPPSPAGSGRPRRIVTFVTVAEFEKLNEIAEREDRSLSAVVHRLLSHALAESP
jgi:hypothetical protein